MVCLGDTARTGCRASSSTSCASCSGTWLRYHNYDIRSPYNRDAALWVASQTTFLFPTDPRPLRDLRAALGRVDADDRDGRAHRKPAVRTGRTSGGDDRARTPVDASAASSSVTAGSSATPRTPEAQDGRADRRSAAASRSRAARPGDGRGRAPRRMRRSRTRRRGRRSWTTVEPAAEPRPRSTQPASRRHHLRPSCRHRWNLRAPRPSTSPSRSAG